MSEHENANHGPFTSTKVSDACGDVPEEKDVDGEYGAL